MREEKADDSTQKEVWKEGRNALVSEGESTDGRVKEEIKRMVGEKLKRVGSKESEPFELCLFEIIT